MIFEKYEFAGLPPETLGFAHGSIDRAAHRRDDANFLEDVLFLKNTKTVVFAGDIPVVSGQEAPLNILFDLKNVPFAGRAAQPIFLGLENGSARFAISLPFDVLNDWGSNADFQTINLRTLAVKSLISKDALNLLATAQALINWHSKHRFCANCGYKTQIKSAGWKRACTACETEHFPRTDPVVIMMAVRGDMCLLGRSPRFPPKMYSCLAGFVEPGESIEGAVRREIIEETGIVIGGVAYHHSQPWPFPMSMMIGCTGEALTEEITVDGVEIEDAQWFSKAELSHIMAGTHPEGLTAPTKMSIAHHLMKDFLS